MGPVTIEFGPGFVRLTQQVGGVNETQMISVPIAMSDADALLVKAWFANPSAEPTVIGNITLDVPGNYRLMQRAGGSTRVVILTRPQVAAVKSWFASYGGTTAPESPLTINP